MWRFRDSARERRLTGLPAGFAVSTVTRLLAAVEATVELVATDQGATVLRALNAHTQKPIITSCASPKDTHKISIKF